MWCITAQLKCPKTNHTTAINTFFAVGLIPNLQTEYMKKQKTAKAGMYH
jgi:hypothetical protein